MGAAITDAIIEAANVSIPRSRPNGRRRKYKPLPYWSGDCIMQSQTKTWPETAWLEYTRPRVQHLLKTTKNAAKCTILNVKFQNFLGGGGGWG